MGENRRPETAAADDEDPHPELTLRQISAWSLAVLAAVAAGFVLYAAREIMLPVVAAFVVGVMLGPAARRLEALHVPRPLVALLLVASVTLIMVLVILLIFPRVSELANGLPGMLASLKEKLQIFDGLIKAWRRPPRPWARRRAATELPFRCPGFPGFPRRFRSCCRRSPAFCFFSSCSFWSFPSGPTCGAPS